MRSSFEIIAEILKTAKNGAKKTRIMYSCGLSYRFVQKYLTLFGNGSSQNRKFLSYNR